MSLLVRIVARPIVWASQVFGWRASEATWRVVLGDLAIAEGDTASAVASYERALVVDPSPRIELCVVFQRASIAAAQGDVATALGFLDRGVALARASGDELDGTTGLVSDIGAQYQRLGEVGRAREAYDLAVQLARRAGDDLTEAVALANAGSLAAQRGDPDAITLREQSVAIFRRHDDKASLATALVNLGNDLQHRGMNERAETTYQEALTLAESVGDRAAVGLACNNLGTMYRRTGRLEDARAAYRRSLEVRRELGVPRGVALVLCNLGDLELLCGDPSVALGFFTEALPLVMAAQRKDDRGGVHCNLAQLYALTGRRAEAREAWTLGLAELREAESTRQEMSELLLFAEFERSEGHVDAAREGLDRALRLFKTAGDRKGEAVCIVQRATLEAMPEAWATALPALNRLRELGDPVQLTRSLLHYARACAALEPARAAEALAEAKGHVRRLGIAATSDIGVLLAAAV